MGKATIVGGGDKGNYTIKMDYGTATRDATVEAMGKGLTDLATKINEARPKLDEAKAQEALKKTAAQTAVNEYVAATQELPAAFSAVQSAMDAVEQLANSATATGAERTAAQAALTQAETDYKLAQEKVKEKLAAQTKAATALVEAKKKTAPLQLALDALVDEQTKLQKDKAYWEGLQLESTFQAWCADYTENGSGEVATMEIPGENQRVLIKPGAPAGNTVDGVLVAREVQSPEQVFFNAAILPGWQKFKPTYRSGVITALNTGNNTASVTLDAAQSSAAGLDINKVTTLANVPVVYMTCHASAFAVGDRCVVRFNGMDWEQPQVVGFVDNPKPCDDYFYMPIRFESDPLVDAGYLPSPWVYLLMHESGTIYGVNNGGAATLQQTTRRLYVSRPFGVTPMPGKITLQEWADTGCAGNSRATDFDKTTYAWANGRFTKSVLISAPYATNVTLPQNPPPATDPNSRTGTVIADVTANAELVLGSKPQPDVQVITDFAEYEAFARTEFAGVPSKLYMTELEKNYELIFDGYGSKGTRPGTTNPDGTPFRMINSAVRYIKRRV
jgi:hypothetical protein